MRSFVPRALIGCLLLASAPAGAWSGDRVWRDDELPIPWSVASHAPFGLPDGDAVDAVRSAHAEWQETGCVGFVETDVLTSGVAWSLGDPDDRLAPGVLAVTSWSVVGPRRLTVIFADGPYWATDEDIDAGGCVDRHSLRSVVTRELGHALGLEASEDPEATMAPGPDVCSTAPSSLATDDIAGVQALYGPTVAIDCAPDPAAVGLAIACTAQAGDGPISWSFGDGSTATGAQVTHTFDAEGTFLVRGCVDTSGAEACPATPCAEQAVTACEPPDVSFRVRALSDGRWRLENETPIRTFGCVDTVRWELLDPSGVRVWESESWEPQVTLAEPGAHRVVLTVAGPGGSGAAAGELLVPGSVGCDVTPGASPGWAGWFVLVVGCLRRRPRPSSHRPNHLAKRLYRQRVQHVTGP